MGLIIQLDCDFSFGDVFLCMLANITKVKVCNQIRANKHILGDLFWVLGSCFNNSC